MFKYPEEETGRGGGEETGRGGVHYKMEIHILLLCEVMTEINILLTFLLTFTTWFNNRGSYCPIKLQGSKPVYLYEIK